MRVTWPASTFSGVSWRRSSAAARSSIAQLQLAAALVHLRELERLAVELRSQTLGEDARAQKGPLRV
jgi:hypothetical protein